MSRLTTEQPDAAILEAFEKVRAHRAYCYSLDNQEIADATETAIEATDQEMEAVEALIHDTPATSIPGILARLQLVIPAIEAERWVDTVIMRDGLLAFHARRYEIDGNMQQLASAAIELHRLAWTTALEAYERSSADFNTALDIKGDAENELYAPQRAGKPHEFADAMFTKLAAFASTLMTADCANVQRLFETPAPDWTAYRRKAEIAIEECLAEEASTWLLRDANALIAAQDREARA